MVKLNKIYTKTGDKGTTGLTGGARVEKNDLRIEAFGAVDETNAAIGVARLQIGTSCSIVADMLEHIQNDLFDLGADLSTPEVDGEADGAALRIVDQQITHLEDAIDGLNAELEPLRSFVLPGGSQAGAALHLARTICRRAERCTVALSLKEGELVGSASPSLH